MKAAAVKVAFRLLLHYYNPAPAFSLRRRHSVLVRWSHTSFMLLVRIRKPLESMGVLDNMCVCCTPILLHYAVYCTSLVPRREGFERRKKEGVPVISARASSPILQHKGLLDAFPG